MNSTTSPTVTASERSVFTRQLMGLLPIQRRTPTTLRASEHFAAIINSRAEHVADDLNAALSSKHREPVSFLEIAQRDTDTAETVAPRHRKPGPACSDVSATRRHAAKPRRTYLGAR